MFITWINVPYQNPPLDLLVQIGGYWPPCTNWLQRAPTRQCTCYVWHLFIRLHPVIAKVLSVGLLYFPTLIFPYAQFFKNINKNKKNNAVLNKKHLLFCLCMCIWIALWRRINDFVFISSQWCVHQTMTNVNRWRQPPCTEGIKWHTGMHIVSQPHTVH